MTGKNAVSSNSKNLKKTHFRYINWFLVVLILSINMFVLVSPLLPQIELWKRKKDTATVAGLPYKTESVDDGNNDRRKDTPKDNRLVIPKIALDQPILTGNEPWLLHKGVWNRPNTSTPTEGGNTVLTGHRFTYDGPATFYSLDKMAVGDRVVVYWQEKEYSYTVTETKVVPATAVEIEKPTEHYQLTLYTCTPIWSAKDRLVVIAKPDKESVQ